MNLPIDFGYSSATTSWDDAYLVLLFATSRNALELGQVPGPMAVADASRFIELFEMQVGVSPLSIGAYAEVLDGANHLNNAVARSKEARARGMFPLIVGEDRRTTEVHCLDPLVALWGKAGRIEAEETLLLGKQKSILAGVRAATANAFQVIPDTSTIITAEALIGSNANLKTGLEKFSEPVHLSIDLDVLSPAVAQTPRSLEPGGLSWYDLMGLIDAVFQGPGVSAVDIVGTGMISPRSPAALLGSQIILKIAGLLAEGLNH